MIENLKELILSSKSKLEQVFGVECTETSDLRREAATSRYAANVEVNYI